MKAGVRTMPCAVAISPARAAPSVAINLNENAWAAAIDNGILNFRGSYVACTTGRSSSTEQQARVAIGVKAIIGGNSVLIGAAHHIETAKCADQHEQGGARQMKIGQDRVDGAEAIAGRDEQSRL